MTTSSPFKRILIKFSGETLLGNSPFGISSDACLRLAKILKNVHDEGFEIGVVIGGGNLYRGLNLTHLGMKRAPADQIGMMATLMNALALHQALEEVQTPSKILTALDCPKVAESFTLEKAEESFSQKKIILFAGGTGNPYFTTDTAAALRGSEMGVDLLVKATKVDGVFESDPKENPNAKKYPTISYAEVLSKHLKIMDATSIALCQTNRLPIFVFFWEDLEIIPLRDLIAQKGKGSWITT